MSFFKDLARGVNIVDKIADVGGNLIEKHLGQPREAGNAESSVKPSESWHQGGSASGEKRAVFIGINYFGTKAELRGKRSLID
jgi:hypothetical protein